MDLSKIKLLNLMQSNLNYLGSRQTVIAQNIANANTPGYEAQDLKKPDFASFMASSTTTTGSLKQTNSNHIAGMNSASKYKKVASNGFEITPSGNRVVLEEEVMKLSRTGMQYQETTGMYRKMIEMLKTAIGNV
jgi:flagellar basal-body rod protein FlgB